MGLGVLSLKKTLILVTFANASVYLPKAKLLLSKMVSGKTRVRLDP